MSRCERATSLPFPPVDKLVQVCYCRVVEFFACPGQNKRTQKNIRCKDDCVGPAHRKLESVCIDTRFIDSPLSTENRPHTNLTEQARKEKMQRNETMKNEQPPLSKGAKLSKKGKQTKRGYGQEVRKKFKRRKKIKTSRAALSCKNPLCLRRKKEGDPLNEPTKFKNTGQSAYDRKSLVSLYRRRRSALKKKQACKCPDNSENLKTVEKLDNDKSKKRRKLHKKDVTFEVEPKIVECDAINRVCNLGKAKKTENCYKGICSKALKKREKDFVCTCAPKKEPAVWCSDSICGKNNLPSNISYYELRSRLFNLCCKSIQKFMPHKICEEGVCQEASKRGNPNITCTCKEKIKTCNNETCVSEKPNGILLKLTEEMKNKLNYNRKPKQSKVIKQVVVQNEIEQTGDPLFEMKVDDIDMCVLNPKEIKGKVLEHGTEKKRNKCICPSHAVQRQYILKRELCLDGSCEAALKNKTTNYTCKCLKNKVWTCTDTDCNKFISSNGEATYAKVNNNKPLFELHVDKDKMCIMNTEDVQDKMYDIHRRKNKLCLSGICEEKSKDRNTRVVCKCYKKMVYDECAEDTCADGDSRCCRCERNHHKMVRSGFDTRSIKKIKSKLSLFCSRMCSKSDNWTSRNKKEHKTRTCRRRNGMIRTQSENNNHKRNGLNINLSKNKNESNIECDEKDCCTCSNDTVPIDSRKDKIFKLSKEQEPNILHKTKRVEVSLPASKVTRDKKRANVSNIVQKNQLKTPSTPDKVMKPNKSIKKTPEALCMCHHTCECGLELEKRRLKNKYRRKKTKSQRRSNKKNKKKKKKSEDKQWARENSEKKKALQLEQKLLMKKDAKRVKKRKQEEREVLKLLESKEGVRRTNCIVELLGAILSAALSAIRYTIFAITQTVISPKQSYRYVRERLYDYKGTWTMVNRAMRDAYRMRKLKVCKCFRNSETVSILSDSFKEGWLYQTFSDKGKTKKQQQIYEIESKARKKRVKQRREGAMYGCRHVLLTTLRKTPCLWVYHVCPECYPQCLSFLGLVKQCWHICLFSLAFACWTPCIVLCELTRGLMCCLLCTG